MNNDHRPLRRRTNYDGLFSNMGMEDFPRMQSPTLTPGKIFKLGLIAWLINGALALIVFGVVGFVIWHFLAKFW